MVATMRDCWREIYGNDVRGAAYGRIPASWEKLELSIRCGRKVLIYSDNGTVVLIRAYYGNNGWDTADSWLKDGKLQRCNRGPAKVASAITALAENVNAMGLRDALKVYSERYVMCCCCGAELTDATSRAKGIGPVCEKKAHGAALLAYLLSDGPMPTQEQREGFGL